MNSRESARHVEGVLRMRLSFTTSINNDLDVFLCEDRQCPAGVTAIDTARSHLGAVRIVRVVVVVDELSKML